MQIGELITWIAAGLAIIAVGLALWQLWEARRESRQAIQRTEEIRRLAAAAQGHAEKAAAAGQAAHAEAQRAWEQVKLARGQLEEARQEHQASQRSEQWEWAYAVTMTAGELVDASQELIRIALDPQVAPHYRMSADRHYRQVSQRWQDTMVKALARTEPDLQMQQQVITFAHVHQRLYGHIGVVLRATETDTLTSDDALTKQALGLRQELNNAYRNLQRSLSASLAPADHPTRQINGVNRLETSNNTPANRTGPQ